MLKHIRIDLVTFKAHPRSLNTVFGLYGKCRTVMSQELFTPHHIVYINTEGV
jgi:hemin uptake protein HemP